MFFRNATMFRFGEDAAKSMHTLAERFAVIGLREPGPMELATAGFVPVCTIGADKVFARFCGNSALFCVGFRARMLPNDVVADETNRRVDAILAGGGTVGHKHRKAIREEVISELLPQAFIRQTRVRAYMDLDAGWLVIDTASRKVAESVVAQVRDALGTFRCTPLTPEESVRQTMTNWLVAGKLPADVVLGDECDLMDPSEGGSKWNGRRADLETDEVREHLSSGMQVFRLGLQYAERVSFVLGEDLVVRKLRFLDSALDDLGEPEDAQAELDARFALMRLEFERLFVIFTKTFGIPREGKLVMDGGDAPKSMKNHTADLDKLAGSPGFERADWIELKHVERVTLSSTDMPQDGDDEMLQGAIAFVRVSQRASISALQRHLQIGYNRAARLIEAMEERLIVSAPAANGARTVLHLGAEK